MPHLQEHAQLCRVGYSHDAGPGVPDLGTHIAGGHGVAASVLGEQQRDKHLGGDEVPVCAEERLTVG